MYHKPVCVKCEVELRPEKNGVKLVDLFQHNTQPYQVWDADLWKCPICGVEIIVGFGMQPLRGHWHDDFSEILEVLKNKYLCKEVFD